MTHSVTPEIIADTAGVSLTEVCSCLQTEEEFVIECVHFGIAEPAGRKQDDWSFPPSALIRIKRAWTLHRDLEINHSGLGMVLELLDELESMQQKMSRLEAQLKQWQDT